MVSTARLNGLIEHSSGDLTATAQAGIAFGQLQTELARAGQFLPLDPAYGEDATLGGILATADAGALRHRYGSLRDLCLGVRFVRADGQVAKAGGRVVKNVAGYDLMKLLGGSFGTLGIVSEITVRLYPLPQATGTVILAGTPDWLQQRAQNLLASHLTPIAVEFLSPRWARRLEVSKEAALLVRFGGSTAGVAEQMGQLVGGTVYQPDAPLWERLQALPWEDFSRVVCKVGVLAAQVSTAIAGFEAIGEERGLAVSSRFAAGSGHGFLRFEPAAVESLVEAIRAARALCQEHRGFLTILEAESTLKRQCDTWGFTGSALPLMGRIKRQFDPEGLLSPHRFVGGL